MLDDPLSLLGIAVWTLAAGMYPLGFMLGASCSPCCNACRNDTCEGFDIEEAFSCRGGGASYCPEFTQGPPLLSLSFSSPCFGDGAAGTVEAPGGNAAGPLISATVTSPGSGYAKFGNKAPTLSLANAATVAASTSVNLSSTQDACGVDYWQVQSLSVTGGGRGYSHGQAVSLSLGAGTVQEIKASATIVAENTQPTLTASVSPGSGGTFTVKTESTGAVLPHQRSWRVASVSVAGKTSGYSNGSVLEFDGEGVTVGWPATAVIETRRSQPTLSASAAVGAGAAFAVTTSSYGNSPETWYVDSVSVTNGGAGYPSEGVLTFSGGTEEYPAAAYFYSGREQPGFFVTADGIASNGSGATLVPLLSRTTSYDGRDVWSVSSITISSGGSGYAEGDSVSIAVSDGTGYGGYGYVSSVDENGAITGIELWDGGEAYKSNGVIESVDVFGGGSYYQDTGEIQNIRIDDGGSYYVSGVLTGISVSNGGKYYHPDPALAPYVTPPVVSVQQFPPSQGAGGQITAVVDSDTSSATFGRVSSLTVDTAGDGYLAWEFVSDFTYLGDGVFAFGRAVPGGYTIAQNPDAFFSAAVNIHKGCWVSGDGIAFGTRVVDGSRELLNDWTLGAKKGCCLFERVFSNGVILQRQGNSTEERCQAQFNNVPFGMRHQNYSWNECEVCNGDVNSPFGGYGDYSILPEIISPKRYTGRYLVTVDPPPESVSGCVTFCGGSGLCGAMPRRASGEEGWRGYGSEPSGNLHALRRMCVRWLCRCYTGTGKRLQVDPETGAPAFPDPSEWYEVASNTEVGGPLVFGGSLSEKLEDAFEREHLFSYANWSAEEGATFCLVWAFVFFGTSVDAPSSSTFEADTEALEEICNLENPDEKFRRGKTVNPVDWYMVRPCERCSCQ